MNTHPLENNAAERDRFLSLTSTTGRAAWRRAVEAVSGSLPSWAERKRNGLRPVFDTAEAVARYRAGGVTLRQVAALYGVTAQALGHHVRKGTPSTSTPKETT